MSFIDELRQARATPSTVLFQLMLGYKAHSGTLHAFFEGQDEESYFTNFLRAYVPADYSLFAHRCRGKGGVFAALAGVDRVRYDMRRLLFFVDRDYDHLIGQPSPADGNLYTTDYYAIESDLAVSELLRRYLRDILHLDDVAAESLIIARFEAQQSEFYELILPVCAWIIHVMRAGLRPNLSNVSLGDLFFVSEDLEVGRHVRPERGLVAYLDRTTGITTPQNAWGPIRSIVRELSTSHPPKVWLRGKFEMWFFVEFALRLPDLLNRGDMRAGKRVIVRTPLNLANAVEVLGPRAPLRPSLKVFLDHHVARLPH